MAIQFDEKGKYYTDVLATHAVAATLQTCTHLVRGFVHLQNHHRLKDELDRPEAFLAVTDAVVLGSGGEELFQAGFLAVSRAQIVWATAADEDEKGRQE
jgi:hypothetical protein